MYSPVISVLYATALKVTKFDLVYLVYQPGICTQKCDGGAEENHWWQWDHKGRWCTVATSWQSWQTGLWLHLQTMTILLYYFTCKHHSSVILYIFFFFAMVKMYQVYCSKHGTYFNSCDHVITWFNLNGTHSCQHSFIFFYFWSRGLRGQRFWCQHWHCAKVTEQKKTNREKKKSVFLSDFHRNWRSSSETSTFHSQLPKLAPWLTSTSQSKCLYSDASEENAVHFHRLKGHNCLSGTLKVFACSTTWCKIWNVSSSVLSVYTSRSSLSKYGCLLFYLL